MPSPPQAYGERFARDVRRIREARGVTLEAIQDATKIPPDLLHQFEEDALFTHRMFNKVYLRSLARSYAELIEVERDDIIAALDAALQGSYGNELAQKYLGDAPVAPVEESDEEAPEPEPTGEEDLAPTSDETVAPIAPGEEVDSEGQEAEAAVGDTSDPAGQPSTVSTEAPPPDQGSEQREPAAEEEPRPGAVVAEEWAQTNKQPVLPFALGGIAAVLVAALIFFAIQNDWASAPETEVTEQVEDQAPMDTVTEPVPDDPPEPEPAPSSATLGDTMRVEVIATFDRVDPIRIRVDDDLRRPYWIEEGESRTFSATQQFILENQLDNIELRLEGYEFPTDQRDEQGRIVITRELAQQFIREAGS